MFGEGECGGGGGNSEGWAELGEGYGGWDEWKTRIIGKVRL